MSARSAITGWSRFRRLSRLPSNQLYLRCRGVSSSRAAGQSSAASAIREDQTAGAPRTESLDWSQAASFSSPQSKSTPTPDPLARTSSASGIEVALDSASLEGRLQEIYGSNHDVNLRIDGKLYRFAPHLLRDSCRCERCVNSSGQKTFETSGIPPDLKVSGAKVNGTNLELTWENDVAGFNTRSDRHKTVLNHSFFKSRVDGDASGFRVPDASPWLESGTVYEQIKSIDYEDFVNHDTALHRGIAGLASQGLIFVRNVPDDEEAVVHIAERIGPIRNTFYGRTWNVKDKPNAENVAYTSHYLGMHMDLLYMKDPPGLQLLHCLRATCKGGESMFADTFGAALQLQRWIPDAFQILTEFPVNFGYSGKDQEYRYTRPTIVPLQCGNHKPASFQLDHVNYSPPFQYPLDMEVGHRDASNRLKRYLHAIRAFASLLQDERNQLRYRLAPGECVIFNNRRIVHGRTAFEPGTGERWLKGTYIDTDAFNSRWRLMMSSSK